MTELSWPKHEASLHLMHNDHKLSYVSVAQAIENEDHGYQDDCWVNNEQKQKAIDTNECWVLQWYPNSPVGFCILSGADLDVVLVEAQRG
jgi:hypothetical protein